MSLTMGIVAVSGWLLVGLLIYIMIYKRENNNSMVTFTADDTLPYSYRKSVTYIDMYKDYTNGNFVHMSKNTIIDYLIKYAKLFEENDNTITILKNIEEHFIELAKYYRDTKQYSKLADLYDKVSDLSAIRKKVDLYDICIESVRTKQYERFNKLYFQNLCKSDNCSYPEYRKEIKKIENLLHISEKEELDYVAYYKLGYSLYDIYNMLLVKNLYGRNGIQYVLYVLKETTK